MRHVREQKTGGFEYRRYVFKQAWQISIEVIRPKTANATHVTKAAFPRERKIAAVHRRRAPKRVLELLCLDGDVLVRFGIQRSFCLASRQDGILIEYLNRRRIGSFWFHRHCHVFRLQRTNVAGNKTLRI